MFEINKYHEDFEDTKEVVSSSKSKNDRQHNGQKKKDTRTNNDIRKLTHKTKDCVARTPANTGGKLRFSERVSCSCSTSGSRRIYIYLTAKKSNSHTVWFNFQMYIFSINLVSLVTLRSSGTDIFYGCHVLLDVCIIYFISCDCIMNSSLSYTIYEKLLS